MSEKYVYKFTHSQTDGNKSMKALLGGKGANLAEMSKIGLPVPPGFTVATIACQDYIKNNQENLRKMEAEVKEALAYLEKEMGRNFGDPKNPLLLSVRSGAAISMPGMMDTVLNLGMNKAVIQGMIQAGNPPRFVWDLYRRFIDMFGNVVMDVSHHLFEEELEHLKESKGVKLDIDLTAVDLEELCNRYLTIFEKEAKVPFPQDPMDQLNRAIQAVLRSWNNPRALTYRRIHSITGLLGTAVNVQCMVFGNRSQTSGTGVLFTRNPSNGKKELFGEYLVNAQGEDVVAGIRTPSPISEMEQVWPETYKEILEHTDRLERHYKNVQDIEFTVEDSKLYILQTRSGKRTGAAALRFACDMVDEKLITEEEAVLNMVEPMHLEQLLHPGFADEAAYKPYVLTKGLPASPGAAIGQVVFSAEEAEAWAKDGKAVILVRKETSPDDVGGMHISQGVVTSRGGMTSHAAVVARGWGKCCVAGCESMEIYESKGYFTVGSTRIERGDWISLNGTTGEVIKGQHALKPADISGDLARFMTWADRARRLRVRANAETPEDAKKAIEFGAEGIGLCRTEHMFFLPERIQIFREMILADSETTRQRALDRLMPFQQKDFEELFEAMAGKPVNIRLLDPPLHEFLPKNRADQEAVAKTLGISVERVIHEVEALHEVNPMLGFRGCRLGIVHSDITIMQVQAIVRAALAVHKKGLTVLPEIMVPLVGDPREMEHQKRVITEVRDQIFAELKDEVPIKIGTMIEIPRAALLAGELAQEAEFFSFGTNDLTQMTFGFSRDDIAHFLPGYFKEKIIELDPFQVLDQKGVGQLIKMAFVQGKKTRPDLKVGICGEHGGEPTSVAFCHQVGLDYVSCSPFRVPIARLAAAQAALREKLG